LLSQYDANFRISTKPKKDKLHVERPHKKIDEILENPEHYSDKKYELKGKNGVHVCSFVIVFEI
jgi:hypothetical protein